MSVHVQQLDRSTPVKTFTYSMLVICLKDNLTEYFKMYRSHINKNWFSQLFNYIFVEVHVMLDNLDSTNKTMSLFLTS